MSKDDEFLKKIEIARQTIVTYVENLKKDLEGIFNSLTEYLKNHPELIAMLKMYEKVQTEKPVEIPFELRMVEAYARACLTDDKIIQLLMTVAPNEEWFEKAISSLGFLANITTVIGNRMNKY